ncbi:MAG TPA: hypothetical protein VN915_09210 [Elusimicrobiota bacterium]|nr:hypothetical protein [Elusimicrobiota bacterium]
MTPSRCDDAEALARGVLHEGYLLDPYTSVPVKDRSRWSFGVLHARGGAGAERGERWSARVQCLASAPRGARLAVRARFLQLESARAADGPGAARARDRQVDSEPSSLAVLIECPSLRAVSFPGLCGELIVRVEPAPGGFLRVTAELSNLSSPSAEPLASAFLSPHLLLGLDRGTFVPLSDPPPEARDAAASCRSDGLRASLVGGGRESSLALASPVFANDEPQLAADATA